MAGMMEKPLDGAGLAVVNQVFNERLSQLGGGGSGGGTDWTSTPYTGIATVSKTNQIFGCALVSIEKLTATARVVRCVVLLNVIADAYATAQTMTVKLPGDYPDLTFTAASANIPLVGGTGTAKISVTGNGTSVKVAVNEAAATLSKGLYIGQATKTVM